ncbi:DNA polymerase III subunit gamma/tau [soil metagenome]
MSDSFDLGEPPQPVKAEAYRVLARKYRPQTFSELIGQDAMITTLGNAIRRGRLAHAFLLTGVRGVGKTSTARLLAKALNCIGPDGQGGPTIDPCGVCDPCVAIAEGRHIDVIEMDAASHTGVDDMRSVIDAARLASFSARFKIYIIDEVHMLSKNAFNALLKTLEEPPAHVKFILATTEVNKVPVTVLSRCQRFDLRRIPADLLAKHFEMVTEAEGVLAEPEALALIARAAEGSARDGLSILDQAIAHAGLEGSGVENAMVRDMLGLSDRGAVRDLFGLLLDGDGPAALAALRRQYDYGVDPQAVLKALLETVHGVTIVKVGAAIDIAQPVEEREALAAWAGSLSFALLHRLWQLLLKGHDEVARAALPIEAGEMALLRVVYASTLPDPGELAKQVANGGPTQHAAPPPRSAEPGLPGSFAELLQCLEENREKGMVERLKIAARVVSFAPLAIVLSSTKPVSVDLIRDLTETLKRITGKAWRITMSDEPGAPTLKEDSEAAQQAETAAVLETPVVKAAFEAFPEAQFISIDERNSA